MKKYILRAPETDRKLVSVPTGLADLTDYGASYASGIGTASTPQTVEATNVENLSLDTFSELTNATSSGGAIAATVPGLYLCIVTLSESWASPGAPNQPRRLGVSKNGAAAYERFVNYDADVSSNAFYDQASFLIRMAAGDTLIPRFQALTAIACDVTARLEIVLVAP